MADLGSLALAAAEALSFEDLAAGVLEPLRRALHGSGVVLYRADPREGLRALGGNLAEAIPAYVADVMARDPVREVLLRHYERGADAAPMAWIARETRDLDWSGFRRGPAHAFYHRYDADDLVLMALTNPRIAPPLRAPSQVHGPLPAAIFLCRSSRQRPFDTLDLRQIRGLLPHLRTAVRRIHRLGDALQAHAAPETSIEASASVARVQARFGLTGAEATVLGLVADGLSNREIAARLFVSIETVRTHVHRILAKLGVHSRGRAAALVRNG